MIDHVILVHTHTYKNMCIIYVCVGVCERGREVGGASLVVQMVKNPPAGQETWILSLGWEDPLKRAWQPTPVFLPGESHGRWSLA